ncbi:hypothetical protein THAOC_20270 [Thalassiosira oceanica]|uniref:Uncharacterized protein n=1 Tax=Thalassiosira oceanica TaxID=159749 RepID=K0SM05_THAOC|nr:hypothetical protein THAOC_20270 [Thalassiosira oceanica]|eukprot:EJK59497.1 hypothetical protein THAOC_20270 [Thalassiosira oceanica]
MDMAYLLGPLDMVLLSTLFRIVGLSGRAFVADPSDGGAEGAEADAQRAATASSDVSYGVDGGNPVMASSSPSSTHEATEESSPAGASFGRRDPDPASPSSSFSQYEESELASRDDEEMATMILPTRPFDPASSSSSFPRLLPQKSQAKARPIGHWPLALGGLTGGTTTSPRPHGKRNSTYPPLASGEARGRTCPGPCVAAPARGERERGEVPPHGRGRRGPGGGGASRTRPSSAAGCVTRRNGAAVGVEWTGASLVDDGYAVIPGASPKYENDERTSRPGAHTNATINSLKWDGEESQPTYHSLRNALVRLHLLGSNDYKLSRRQATEANIRLDLVPKDEVNEVFQVRYRIHSDMAKLIPLTARNDRASQKSPRCEQSGEARYLRYPSTKAGEDFGGLEALDV